MARIVGFKVLLTNKNIGLRLRVGGDGHCGKGEDGGLERVASSENTWAASAGLEGGTELLRADEQLVERR